MSDKREPDEPTSADAHRALMLADEIIKTGMSGGGYLKLSRRDFDLMVVALRFWGVLYLRSQEPANDPEATVQ